jgi:molybdate transport repressor ModE-like protein
MRLVATLTWRLPGDPSVELDPRLVPLLEAIAANGSLAAAVAVCKLSYRAGWGLLRDFSRDLGVPLVTLERGRGARLAPAGTRLLGAHRVGALRLARMRPALAIELGAETAARRKPAKLRVAASHDLALAALRDALPSVAGLALDVRFVGSLDALQQLAEGRADLAGFHVPLGRHAAGELAPFRRLLKTRRDRLIRFVEREQGFMLPHGNPARVHAFGDLVRKRLRFVNRQRGSGTRLLIDRLLAEEGVAAAELSGYGREEFTHAAVAATVASGAADAGFGLRAAAAEQGLAFVPRARERYYLALHARALATPAVARLVEALEGPLLTRIVRRMPGYRSDRPGTVVEVGGLND